MPWKQSLFKGQKVIARVSDSGQFAAVDGRVEYRYKTSDPRSYRAALANLSHIDGAPVLADDACVPSADSADAPRTPRAKASSGSYKAGAIPEGAWIAYADGACSGNPGPAGLGIVVVEPNGKMHDGYEYLGEGTNNIAELAAILRALEAAPSAAPYVIHTDSQYSIGVLSKGWKAKANQELIRQVKAKLAERSGVSFVYVPGHAGVPLNERADALAREAVRTRGKQAIRISGTPQ